MELTSDIDAVGRDIDELIASFGFQIAGVRGRSLADDMVHAVAEAISEDCRQGVAPDGSEWADNKEPYKTWKAEKYGSYSPGYKTGATLSLRSLKGDVDVTNEEIKQTHGVGDVDEDGETDKNKGVYLTEGHNSSPRPFYAFNEARAEKVATVAGEGLDHHLESKTGGV
ncbi:MAG: hypothetical protein KGL39_27420 [Patescibacteria group bacterium]|nr:hypothetical protein [Patescibacteria group bacterium]